MTLDQPTSCAIGAVQWNPGHIQIDGNTFSPVINVEAGHASGTQGRARLLGDVCYLAEGALRGLPHFNIRW